MRLVKIFNNESLLFVQAEQYLLDCGVACRNGCMSVDGGVVDPHRKAHHVNKTPIRDAMNKAAVSYHIHLSPTTPFVLTFDRSHG